MGIEEKIFYNEGTAMRFGWFPSWFGAKHFDGDLIRKIRQWQKKNKLKADGLVGPKTFRRIYTEKEAEKSELPEKEEITPSGVLYYNGEEIPIAWDKVVTWHDAPSSIIVPNESSYYAYDKGEREIDFFVNHWDATLSAATCSRILARRNLSVHFCIDNDGTIYQLLDMQHAAKHAGRANRTSVGVEISNAYYLKYQSTYKRKGFPERPVITNARVHGRKLKPFTGFYPVQLEALKALWSAVADATGIPLECPLDSNGELVTGVDYRARRNSFKGFVNHYNLSRKKIDCAGLELDKLLQEIKDEKA